MMRIIVSILLIINIINPRLGWKIWEGWKYKNVEPSDGYLYVSRVLAVLGLILVWFVVE
ncbi:histidine kinase [Clostridium sp. Cult1]|nr:histidine kinase [Clostridium sp. Cult1]